jgi:predicted porin
MVMESQNVKDKATGGIVKNSYDVGAFSGRYNPGFSKKIDAIMLNGFLKAGGLELFGTYETTKGRSKTETTERKMNQLAGDVVYRFGKNENLFIGARYNTVTTELVNVAQDVKINRLAGAAGWFLTKNILLKGEIVNQEYKDFPTSHILNGGKFNGFVMEAVVGF